MQARELKSGVGGVNGVGQVDGSIDVTDEAFIRALSGGGMDVGALGIKQNLMLREQGMGITVAMMNRENDQVRKVIDSMGT